MKENEALITRKEAAVYLTKKGYRVSPESINVYGTKGPPYYKLGKRVAYAPSELDSWFAKLLKKPNGC